MSEIIVDYNPFLMPICNDCVHRIKGLKCKAFSRIPDDILFGEHSRVYPGQKGQFLFKKK